MRPHIVVLGVLFGSAVLFAACGNGDVEPSPTPSIDPADFRPTVDNPFFPLDSLGPKVFEGEERDPDTGEVIETRVESTVLPDTAVVAGVEVTVVEEKEFGDGELIEVTLDYYAQHRDGTVYYLGERVDDYEDGQVVGHEGQWLAGEGGNLPGVFMPADPVLGLEFEQERAPGLAEDRSKVVAVDLTVTTVAGTFMGCIKTEDFDPIGDETEFKYYCTGVGLVKEESPDGELALISY